MIIYFFIALAISLLLSFSLYRLGIKYKLVDNPDDQRKKHSQPTPNLGGIAIFLSFWITIALFVIKYQVQGEYLHYLTGAFIGSLLLAITGLIDDRKNLSPFVKISAQILAALAVVASGVGIATISNPIGGMILLNQINIPVLTIGAITYHLTLLADILAIAWIIIVINTLNFLDGLDGLAAGTAIIAFCVITILSSSPAIAQPLSAIIALIGLGAVAGFLPLNLPRAKMFMGDTGSTFIGFVLAVLAIIAGSKLATALLVLGLPIFDSLWVTGSRILKGKKPWEAGYDHLHHKLIKLGMSPRAVVLIFWTITMIFGAISLTTTGIYKMASLVVFVFILVVAMIAVDKRILTTNKS